MLIKGAGHPRPNNHLRPLALQQVEVAQNENDVFMETWPVLHADYLDKYSDSLYDVGIIYEGTQVGLVVPQYMVDDGVKTISDLKKPEIMEKLRGEITGIDSGAGMMQDIENEVMPGYGLDEAGYKLVAYKNADDPYTMAQQWVEENRAIGRFFYSRSACKTIKHLLDNFCNVNNFECMEGRYDEKIYTSDIFSTSGFFGFVGIRDGSKGAG